jgi:DNA-binding response OmpR family regulator
MMKLSYASSICPDRGAGKTKGHILLVASHPTLADLLFWMLSLAGYQVTRLTREEALAGTLLTEMGQPALLLLALHGLLDARQQEELEQLRARWKVPMLVLLDDAQYAFEGHLLGKPFHLHDVFRQIERLMASAPSPNEPDDEGKIPSLKQHKEDDHAQPSKQ